MKLIATSTILGALAFAAIAATTPASAMPASVLAPVASDASSTASPLEKARFRRPLVRRRVFVPRRGYRHGYRRPGPIRRIIRAL